MSKQLTYYERKLARCHKCGAVGKNIIENICYECWTKRRKGE